MNDPCGFLPPPSGLQDRSCMVAHVCRSKTVAVDAPTATAFTWLIHNPTWCYSRQPTRLISPCPPTVRMNPHLEGGGKCAKRGSNIGGDELGRVCARPRME